MNFQNIEISLVIFNFFRDNIHQICNIDNCNLFLEKSCGIKNFFCNDEQLNQFKSFVSEKNDLFHEPNRREYGDFQTNQNLALKSVQYLLSKKNINEFDLLIEPTCGKGNFIIASLSKIENLKKVIGIEIYLPYVWETKFKILEYYIQREFEIIPEIEIIHANVFDFDFTSLSKKTINYKTLIIGNPPWVTNSELSSIDSQNLPKKSNFKKHRGFDAITGKGNFDIAEYISLIMLRNFDKHNGCFSFLLKNSVVKNLINDQKQNQFRIGAIEKLNIDSKKEFNVSVDACLFITKLNQKPELFCKEFDFYSMKERTVFGWINGNFVYSMTEYNESSNIDGKSQFIWRQGIKHDCSKIMEIEKFNNHYKNGLNQELDIENDLVYGLIKSSDLKDIKTNSYRKLTIVTQKKIGQDTNYIEKKYPLTHKYLTSNKEYFDKRKSSIYLNKPDFSIFGVGEYSFMPYKVAISGLYKSTHFTLIFPDRNKPIMLDDTCYFIGFDDVKKALIAHYLLNQKHTQHFLKSIIFRDSKRAITKEILMRIDFDKIFNLIDFNIAQMELINITEKDWKDFGEVLKKNRNIEKITLF